MHRALFFLRGYFRVQTNLCNYLWNLKTLTWKNIRDGDQKYENFECVRKCLSQSVKTNVLNFKIQSLFIEVGMLKKQAMMGRMRIGMRFSTKKSKRMCLIITQRELDQNPKGCHSALWKCQSALQKCRKVLLGADRTFVFGCAFDSFFRFS